MRFLKLPLLSHFLQRYARVLYFDDDVLIGPAMPDLFARVPCTALGANALRQACAAATSPAVRWELQVCIFQLATSSR